MRLRRQAGALVVAAVAFASLLAAAAPAGTLDACAQRVIRDWYTGGRVDDVYPLACYRAALRALPADVLQYSNADQDIRRALAYARRGRSDPGAEAAAAPKRTAPAESTTKTGAADPKRAAAPPAQKPTPKAKARPVARQAAPATQTAGLAPEPAAASAALPYPILVLTALAAVLLTTGAAGWVIGRRR
jgi:hypothetical protein